MTFAAFEIETVGSPVVVTAEEPWAALTFGSLPFGSLPGVADPLDGVDGALLGGDTLSIAELGATSAADGGTEPTDAVGEELVAAGADDGGGWVAGLCDVAVDVTDGASEMGGATTRGAGDSTFVTGGLDVVGADAGVSDVTTGAVVTCVTGGAVVTCVTGGGGGSTACCVCGGASTLGATGSGAGAFGGGTSCDGASTAAGACTFGSGAGAVVVTTGSVFGLANAGAIPPVSAVREITTPDARTATTLRLEQNSCGALICASTPLTSRRVADCSATAAMRSLSPTLGPVQQLPRL
jgi:hypothetical protein